MKRCGTIEAVGLLNKHKVSSMPRDLQHKGRTGRRHAEKKWAKTPGRGRVQKWTFVQSGFALFGKKWDVTTAGCNWSAKSLRFCSFRHKKSQGLLFFEKWHGGRKKTKGRTHPPISGESRALVRATTRVMATEQVCYATIALQDMPWILKNTSNAHLTTMTSRV